MTPDQLHAWRLHDQYMGVIAQLDDAEGQRRRLGSDVKHDAQGGVSGGVHVATAGYGRDMKLLNQRIAELTKKVADLEAAWDRKFQGRFGPLKDARESIYDPSTKTKMDKIAFRLKNFAFDPDKPQPAPTTTTPAERLPHRPPATGDFSKPVPSSTRPPPAAGSQPAASMCPTAPSPGRRRPSAVKALRLGRETAPGPCRPLGG